MTRKHKHDGQCVEEFNKLVNFFNDLLPVMLHNLTATLPGSTFIDGLAHWIGYDAVTQPKKYGMRNNNSSRPFSVQFVSYSLFEILMCRIG